MMHRRHSGGQKDIIFVLFLSFFQAYVYIKAPTVTSRGSNSSMMNYFYFFYNVLPLKKVVANAYTGIYSRWITIPGL
nr:MAG TPA: hypothetical protein [Caudoviricetes sp.]